MNQIPKPDIRIIRKGRNKFSSSKILPSAPVKPNSISMNIGKRDQYLAMYFMTILECNSTTTHAAIVGLNPNYHVRRKLFQDE